MPAGYSFNMIGPSIALAMAVAFAAPAGVVHLSIAR
jgi:Na+/H+-dicarboxylate symporter